MTSCLYQFSLLPTSNFQLRLQTSDFTLRSRASPDEVDDFNLVAGVDRGLFERRSLQHHEVVLNGHSTRVDLELGKQCADGERRGELARFAVQHDGHESRLILVRFSLRRSGHEKTTFNAEHAEHAENSC